MFAHTHPRITTGVAASPRAPPAVSTSPDKAARGAHTLNGVNTELSRRMAILASQTVNTFLNKSFLLHAPVYSSSPPPSPPTSTPFLRFHPRSLSCLVMPLAGFRPRIGELSFALRIILRAAVGEASKGIHEPGQPLSHTPPDTDSCCYSSDCRLTSIG